MRSVPCAVGCLVAVAFCLLPWSSVEAQETSCVTCHSDSELFDGEWLELVESHSDGIHADVGIGCHDCHGGNPDPALFEDTIAAMDPDWGPNPYRGIPEAVDVPAFCGSCHADTEYMRSFGPDIRVDQLTEYRTSRHGELLVTGDTAVATCVSCHGSHGILRPTDPQSRVFPTHVADTCSECHSSPEIMGGRELPNGLPLPIDQHSRWSQSVHAEALIDREDYSAPTCNDCHGNHGAAPPGLASVNFVCGQCHGREADLFRASDKRAGFADHAEFLEEAGPEGCAACHFEPEAPAAITDVRSLGECASCHGNHGVVRPNTAMLSPLPETPCHFCHEGAAMSDGALEAPDVVARYRSRRDELLASAAELGLEGDRRFDWMVDAARSLPEHGIETEEGLTLGAEFRTLYERFRIGKTSFEYEHPATGETVRAELPRCATCHSTEEAWGDDAVGLAVSENFRDNLAELSARTAAAERALLRAHRGGVQTRGAAGEIEAAIDAQISAVVLIHRFAAGEGSEFQEAVDTGLAHAGTAVSAGQEALQEVEYRRLGLLVALLLIALVLTGLGMKIRQLDARG